MQLTNENHGSEFLLFRIHSRVVTLNFMHKTREKLGFMHFQRSETNTTSIFYLHTLEKHREYSPSIFSLQSSRSSRNMELSVFRKLAAVES